MKLPTASKPATPEVKGVQEWGKFYADGGGSVYPDENLLRIIRGKYVEVPRTGRALDVGFGRGGNLVMLAKQGFEAHGLEISTPSVDGARMLAKEHDVRLQVDLLNGTRLPYPDRHFDLVVSWGAVYYFGNRTLVARAIQDFHRVLKPGGVLLMSVIHPNSFMSKRLTPDLGDGTHRIIVASEHDTRLGLEIFFSPTSEGWRDLLRPFAEVKEGYAEMNLFNDDRRDAWRLFWARKK